MDGVSYGLINKNKMLPNVTNGQALYEHAKTLIPGATHLFGKRAELYAPDIWPCYYSKAKGCIVWDIDGNKYLDFTMVGIGANALGYSDPYINRAVSSEVNNGNNCTLNNTLEVRLADKLIELHPWADMVRYARTGGEMASVAVRIARAASGRTKVIVCGYHGWHDWYLAANIPNSTNLNNHLLSGLESSGVPRQLDGTTLPVRYGILQDIQETLSKHTDIAALVIEPFRSTVCDNSYLASVRELCSNHGIVLIYDEITTGFRECLGGMHLLHDAKPDMCLFGKTLSNGIPMAALVGRRSIMEAAQSSFISSTYWTDSLGPAAALAYIKRYGQLGLDSILKSVGLKIRDNIKQGCINAGFDVCFSGPLSLTSFKIDHPMWPEVLTLFTQLMLEEGILASDRSYSNYAHHKRSFLSRHAEAVWSSLAKIAEADATNNIISTLRTRVKASTFVRI